MNKKIKKGLASILAVLSIFNMVGCNKQVVDTTYAFKTAVMKNDGNVVLIPLQQWRDYKAESVQLITMDRMAVVTSSYLAELISPNKNKDLADAYAKEMTDADGTLSYYGPSSDGNENINFQLLDFQKVFDKAIILQNGRAVIIPVAKWDDYSGEQIQVITPENVVLLLSDRYTLLVRDKYSLSKAIDLAQMLVGEDGVVVDLAGDYVNDTFYNKQFADLRRAYNKAIEFGDESDALLALKSWTDYEDGEQFQIKISNGGMQLCSSFNTALINDVHGVEVTGEKIAAALNPNFKDFTEGNETAPGIYNKQVVDLSYLFQDAVINSGKTSAVLPIKNWRDYAGEQLQFTYTNGVTMLGSSVDISAFCPNDEEIKTKDIAQAISSDVFVMDPNYKLSGISNKLLIDLKNAFPYALVVNDDSIAIFSIKSWRDFDDSEQFQLVLSDKTTTFLTNAYDTKLVNLGKSGVSIQDVASWLNKDGSKRIVDLTDGKVGKGLYNREIIDIHFLFNYAISVNGDTAMIIPIEKWKDYDGDYIEDEDGNRTYTDYTEQLQIYFDGSSKIYSDNTNIKLVKAEDLDTVIAIASSYLSENGTVKLYESQDLIRRLN